MSLDSRITKFGCKCLYLPPHRALIYGSFTVVVPGMLYLALQSHKKDQPRDTRPWINTDSSRLHLDMGWCHGSERWQSIQSVGRQTVGATLYHSSPSYSGSNRARMKGFPFIDQHLLLLWNDHGTQRDKAPAKPLCYHHPSQSRVSCCFWFRFSNNSLIKPLTAQYMRVRMMWQWCH